MSNLRKIESFTINHKLLVPGIYISRKDKVGKDKTVVTTFDIRVKRPNFEDCMQPATVHTIEHLGATYLRSDERWKDKVIYFGPMGCLTGFYMILDGDYEVDTPKYNEVVAMIMNMFDFIVKFDDRIPGTTPIECGNYRLHNLESAKNVCANMIVLYETFDCLKYEYPTEENSKGIADSCSVNSEVLHKSVLPEVDDEYYDTFCDKIEYDEIVEVDKSLDCSEEEIEREMNDEFVLNNGDLFPEEYEQLTKEKNEHELTELAQKLNDSTSEEIVFVNQVIADNIKKENINIDDMILQKTDTYIKDETLNIEYESKVVSHIDSVNVQCKVDKILDSSTLHAISRKEAIDKAKSMKVVADALF